MDKNELRASVLSVLKGYGRRREESEEIVRIVVSHPKWKEATTILAFSPLSTEPDISPLLSDKRILLPYITEDGSMEFGKGEMRKSRCDSFFAHPVSSVTDYTVSLMRLLFQKVLIFQDAMYSRGWSEDGERTKFRVGRKDMVFLVCSIVLFVGYLLWIKLS